eukprot:SAG22_NODE_1695_length_3796_cov_3.361915_2_plen_92_part_00
MTVIGAGTSKNTLTQVGNASGPFPLGLPKLDPAAVIAGKPLPPLPNRVPDAVFAGGTGGGQSSAEIVRDGYDLQRRLGRLDLARHYAFYDQ